MAVAARRRLRRRSRIQSSLRCSGRSTRQFPSDSRISSVASPEVLLTPRAAMRPARKARGARIPGVFNRRATPRPGMQRRPNVTGLRGRDTRRLRSRGTSRRASRRTSAGARRAVWERPALRRKTTDDIASCGDFRVDSAAVAREQSRPGSGKEPGTMQSKPITVKGVSVRAISGTHVVFLAMNLSDSARKGCLGFAIKRRDDTEDEEYWLQGLKTFASVDPSPGPGVPVSTRLHPLQGFQWADYTAKADHKYTYEVTPMYGTPAALDPGTAVSIDIRTEPTEGEVHEIHFNRGAVASQEYARRFQNRKPDQVADGSAYRWLS